MILEMGAKLKVLVILFKFKINKFLELYQWKTE